MLKKMVTKNVYGMAHGVASAVRFACIPVYYTTKAVSKVAGKATNMLENVCNGNKNDGQLNVKVEMKMGDDGFVMPEFSV